VSSKRNPDAKSRGSRKQLKESGRSGEQPHRALRRCQPRRAERL